MIARLTSYAFGTALLLGCAGTALADAKSPVTAADTVFLQDAAADGLAEVQMGKMALSTSTDENVKALAQRIVDDHTKANDAIKGLAQSRSVTLPTSPGSDAQKQGKKLEGLKGSPFDEAWSKDMVDDHKNAIKMFTKEGKQTKDAELQQFVTSTLPALKSHLDASQQLASVPDARDKAMDQATKSMGSAMDSSPEAASVAKPAVATPVPTAAPAAAPAPAPVAPAAKH